MSEQLAGENPDLVDLVARVNNELDQMRRLSLDVQSVLRVVDANRFLASLDTRLADLRGEVAALQATNVRVKELATSIETERVNAVRPASRATVIWSAAIVVCLQAAVFVLLAVK